MSIVTENKIMNIDERNIRASFFHPGTGLGYIVKVRGGVKRNQRKRQVKKLDVKTCQGCQKLYQLKWIKRHLKICLK